MPAFIVSFCLGIVVARFRIHAPHGHFREGRCQSIRLVGIARFVVVLEIHRDRADAICGQLSHNTLLSSPAMASADAPGKTYQKPQ